VNHTAIVLAGGLGTRLAAITADRYPKPMVLVPLDRGSVPFLEFPLAHLRAQGITKILVCIGHLGARIQEHFGDGRRFGLDIGYDDAGAVLTGTRLLHAMRQTTASPLLVVCGDVYHPLDLRRFLANLRQRPGWLMQLAARLGPGDAAAPANLALDSEEQVLAYDARGVRAARAGVETGTLALHRQVLDAAPEATNFSLTEGLYPRLIAQRSLGAFVTDADFFDIGTPERFARFCGYARSGGAVPLSRQGRG
jgi:NDP-sugar pyrophosphorylase family protein